MNSKFIINCQLFNFMMPTVNGVTERRSSRIRQGSNRATGGTCTKWSGTAKVNRTDSLSQKHHNILSLSSMCRLIHGIWWRLNALTSSVAAMQHQLHEINKIMCSTSRTDVTAANKTMENTSNYLQTHNAINNMQHTG